MYYFARASGTKYHRLGGLNSRHFISPSSGGWKSKIKGLAGLVSSKASLLGLQRAAFYRYAHVAVSAHLCAHSYWILAHPRDLLCLSKDSIYKYSHLLRYQGLGL